MSTPIIKESIKETIKESIKESIVPDTVNFERNKPEQTINEDEEDRWSDKLMEVHRNAMVYAGELKERGEWTKGNIVLTDNETGLSTFVTKSLKGYSWTKNEKRYIGAIWGTVGKMTWGEFLLALWLEHPNSTFLNKALDMALNKVVPFPKTNWYADHVASLVDEEDVCRALKEWSYANGTPTVISEALLEMWTVHRAKCVAEEMKAVLVKKGVDMGKKKLCLQKAGITCVFRPTRACYSVWYGNKQYVKEISDAPQWPAWFDESKLTGKNAVTPVPTKKGWGNKGYGAQ